jgi:hypothetical protein
MFLRRHREARRKSQAELDELFRQLQGIMRPDPPNSALEDAREVGRSIRQLQVEGIATTEHDEIFDRLCARLDELEMDHCGGSDWLPLPEAPASLGSGIKPEDCEATDWTDNLDRSILALQPADEATLFQSEQEVSRRRLAFVAHLLR